MKAKRNRGAWHPSGDGASTTAVWVACGVVLMALGMQFGAAVGGPSVAESLAAQTAPTDGALAGVRSLPAPVADDSPAPSGEGYFDRLVTLISVANS